KASSSSAANARDCKIKDATEAQRHRERMKEELHYDFEEEPNPELNRLTNLIIGACIEVHKELGPGYVETYYERALEREFQLRGISFSRQHKFEVRYKG